MDIHRRIAGIVGRRLRPSILAAEALETRSRFEQCAIDGEVFVREQTSGARLPQDRVKKSASDIALQQRSGCVSAKRAARLADEREAFYRLTLRSYSEALQLGMTRKAVEVYLRGKGKAFKQMCCMQMSAKNAYDDLTKIGEESHPWYCEAHNVDIGFEFVSAGSHKVPEAHEWDTLTKIMVDHWLEGCL